MVDGNAALYKLEDVLTKQQVTCIMKQLLKGYKDYNIIKSEIKSTTSELSGFLGEYFRISLHVTDGKVNETLKLFVKRLPHLNQPKAEFINSNNYARREAILYRLINELTDANDPHPWCTRALIHNENLLVMVDLQSLGYSSRPQMEPLDLPHVLTAVSAVARFHAAIANYETRKTMLHNKPWTVLQEYSDILAEANFTDTPWMDGVVKLTANLLTTFSNKYNNIKNLEAKLRKLFLQACDELREHENTLNVLVHKDLWINNIMFRYEKDVPMNALLIDYQCLRYGPPSFDLMIILYCTTSRSFREQYENVVLRQYFSIFVESLEDSTKHRLDDIKYNETEFLNWCERSRKFGCLVAIGILPYTLMDPTVAKKTYDDPETYEEYLVDRTRPVVAYCRQNPQYKLRQLEVCEEFVERFVEI